MFLSGMLARGRTRVKLGLRLPLGRAIPWGCVAGWMGGIFYLSHQSALPGQRGGALESVVAHLGLYTGLGALLVWALAGVARCSNRSGRWVLAVCAFALAVLYGATDELHQAFIPARSASQADIALDAAGAAIGSALAVAGGTRSRTRWRARRLVRRLR